MTVNRMSKSSMAAPVRYRNVSTGTVISPVVSGGILSEDSTYYYRTFLTSGTLSVSGGSLTADVLVISGGGCGGPGFGSGRGGAGGGAGGMKSFNLTLSSPATVTIGAGGAGVLASPTNSGTSSSISTASTTGGGGGAHGAGGAGLNGGSGGGNGGYDSVAGLGIAGQGNNGGTTTRQAYADPSAGGGGAGAIGGTPAGGAGLTSTISGTSTTYATGGTGGSQTGLEAGASGAASTGNGGNGGGGNNSVGVYGGVGGNGGSGIVIVRYAKEAITASTDSYELIGTIELSATQASITFTGIPQQYKNLQVRMVSATVTGADRIISLTGTEAGRRHYLQAYEASTYTSGTDTRGYLDTGGGTGDWYVHIIDILDFASTTKNKTIRGLAGTQGSSAKRISLNSLLWASNAAVTSVTFSVISGSYIAGTRISLYGLRG